MAERSKAEVWTGVAGIPGVLLAQAALVCLVLGVSHPAATVLYVVTGISLIPLAIHFVLRMLRRAHASHD